MLNNSPEASAPIHTAKDVAENNYITYYDLFKRVDIMQLAKGVIKDKEFEIRK